MFSLALVHGTDQDALTVQATAQAEELGESEEDEPNLCGDDAQDDV